MHRVFRGYRVDEVEAFLDRCAATLGVWVREVPELQGRSVLSREPRLTADDVARVRFRIAFRGYPLDEVDALLDRIEQVLRRSPA